MLQLRKAAKIPQLLTRMSFLVDARLPSACVCWRICRFKASHYEDNQPPWAELQSTQARRPLHLFPSLGVCTAEPDTCSQADWMPLFQCCPSLQLQEAGRPGRCVGMGAPAQKGQEVTAAPKALLALRLTDITHLAIKITLSAFIFRTELLKCSCMKTCLLGMQ